MSAETKPMPPADMDCRSRLGEWLQLRASPEMMAALEHAAERTGMTKSEYVRRAVGNRLMQDVARVA
jgi:predicted DNA-binding protein